MGEQLDLPLGGCERCSGRRYVYNVPCADCCEHEADTEGLCAFRCRRCGCLIVELLPPPGKGHEYQSPYGNPFVREKIKKDLDPP